MKVFRIFFLLPLFLFTACNNTDQSQGGESDIDAARNFIQAALKGKYDLAKNYMLQDSINNSQLNAVSRIHLSSNEKQGLWDASINIHERKSINDSISIIVYSNSFHRGNKDTLKVVKEGKKWLVDLKYLFFHDSQPQSASFDCVP